MASSAGAALAVLVSIRVAPDVSPEFSAAAARSCDTALGEGKCRIEDDASLPAEFHADVTSSGSELDSARIELRKDPNGPSLEMRQLTFASEDSPRERWASVGVVVAALVVARSREPTPQVTPPRSTPRRQEPVRRLPKPAHTTPRTMFRIDARALVAHRIGGIHPEIGGELASSVLPAEGPWFGAFSIAAARRFGVEPELTWLSASLGFGARVGKPTARWATEYRGAVVGEYWSFAASEPGRAEHSGGFRAGGLLGADALWALHRRWILSVGIEALFVVPRMRVDVEGHLMERVPEYGAVFLAGVRFSP